MKKLTSLILLTFICMTISISAHPGSLDENGGHWNRKTGEYHYHDGSHTESSNSNSSNVKYDNVIFEDKIGKIKFLIPKSWTKESTLDENGDFHVEFDCGNGIALFYYRSALTDSFPKSKEDFSEAFEVETSCIEQYHFNDSYFYCFPAGTDAPFYYAITFTDNFLHMFLQRPNNNKMPDELSSTIASFAVLASSNQSTEFKNYSNATQDTESSSKNTNNSKVSSDKLFNLGFIIEYVFLGFIVLICSLFYGIPLIILLWNFIYDNFLEKCLPRYNLKMYAQTIESIKRCKCDLGCFQKTINDYPNIKIPPQYEIGPDNLPKEKSSDDWGKEFTMYKSPHGQKLHSQYSCCNATKKIHVYQAFVLSSNPYDSLCKLCCHRYSIPNLEWYQVYLAKKNIVPYKKRLTELYKKLHDYNRKCNSLHIKFLLLFNKSQNKKLRELNNIFSHINR